eukprot:UN22487
MVMRDENAPQRTRTAYMFFCDKNRNKVVKNNPDSTMVEISALMGKLWSETNEKARAPFVTSMEKSKAKYEKEMEAYRQTSEYTEFQKKKNLHNLIAKYVEKIPGAKKKIAYKTFPSDPNKPKRPLSAYFLFSNDNRDSVTKKNPDASMAEIGKMLGEAWKKASGTVRSNTKTECKLKEKYDVAFEKYQSTKKCKEYLALREEYDKEP